MSRMMTNAAARSNTASQFAPDSRPPPSTIAAQIAEQGVSTAPNAGNATFKQLLDEIVAHPEGLESDWRSNHKLISVAATAGLRAANTQDPFVHTRDEMIACLEVINLAFRKTPEVLFNTDASMQDFETPLCLTLLPMLLDLIDSSTNASVLKSTEVMLSSFLQKLNEDCGQWLNLNRLLSFYIGIASDAFGALERLNESGSIGGLSIPSAETVDRLDLSGQVLVAISSTTRLTTSDPQRLVLIGSIMLMSVSMPGSDWRLGYFGASDRNLRQCLALLNATLQSVKIFKIELNNATYLQFSSTCLRITKLAFQSQNRILFHSAATTLLECVGQMTTHQYLQRNGDWRQVALFAISSISDMRVAAVRLKRSLPWKAGSDFLNYARSLFDDPEFQGQAAKLQAIYEQLSLEDGNSQTRTDVALALQRLPIPHGRAHNQSHHLSDKRPKLNEGKADGHAQTSPLSRTLQSLDILPMPALLASFGGSTEDPTKHFDSLSESERSEFLAHLTRFLDENKLFDDQLLRLLEQTLDAFVGSESFKSSRKVRVEALEICRRFFERCTVHVDMSSRLVQSCLQGLRSSSREVRIVSADVSASLLRKRAGHDEHGSRRNRVVILDYLRQMSDADSLQATETVIMALGRISRVVDDQDLNVTLLKLVEFLGHSNPLIYSLADLELRQLENYSGVGMEDMLRPYWKTIAITAVKDLLSRPQVVQRLSDLLGMTVGQLLVLTQSETIPYLVLWRKTDVLARIVAARGPDATVWSTIMNIKNLVPVLTLLLTQESPNVEAMIGERLAHASADLENEDVTGLVKSYEIPIACELLKLAGDADENSRDLMVHVLHTFSTLGEAKSTSSRSAKAQTIFISNFLETRSLGIVTAYADSIESPATSKVEKRRLLRAVKAMIHSAGASATVALPQIRACLQSAMQKEGLSDDAFEAWAAILPALQDSPDILDIVAYTFAFIRENWDMFSIRVQKHAHSVVAEAVRAHSSTIQDGVELLPSLASIPMFAKIESQLARLRSKLDVARLLAAFARRCKDENSLIVSQSLHELDYYLVAQESHVQELLLLETPSSNVVDLIRALLDVCSKYNREKPNIATKASKCLGVIGCVDPNRVEAVREKHDMVVLSNFETANEAVEFITFFLDSTLVKAFHSVSNPRAQGFLAYVMQELLRFCAFTKETTHLYRPLDSQTDDIHRRWMAMPETTRGTLIPFLSSHYVLKAWNKRNTQKQSYPVFSDSMSHAEWLWLVVCDLLQRSIGENAQMMFHLVARIVKGFDVSIATFLLPYVVTNVVLAGTKHELEDVQKEIVAILGCPMDSISANEQDQLRLCSENIFQTLDYMSKWLQTKRRHVAAAKTVAARTGKSIPEVDAMKDDGQIRSIETLLGAIPADVISQRAVECKSFTRALLHWEGHIRKQRGTVVADQASDTTDRLYSRLQEIYSQIDEPDGIEGMSAQLQVVDTNLQVQQHQRAGRWEIAHSYYEYQLLRSGGGVEWHQKLLHCLQSAGQYQLVLRHSEAMPESLKMVPAVESIVAEAVWSGADKQPFEQANKYIPARATRQSFNAGLADAFEQIMVHGDESGFHQRIEDIRSGVASRLNATSTSSTQACHHLLLQLHALHDVELLASLKETGNNGTHTRSSGSPDEAVEGLLHRRLDILGHSSADKLYLLGIQRAMRRGSRRGHEDPASTATEIFRGSESWLVSARLARKAGNLKLAYDAIIRASQSSDRSAIIEESRLLWKSGEHRKAIQSLQGAIATGMFTQQTDTAMLDVSFATESTERQPGNQNFLSAQAHLLLARWLDQAGQTQSNVLNKRYQHATREYHRWEKGLYHLGRFYNKLLDAEKAQPLSKQHLTYLTGETSKLVIENYLRSLIFGCKYISHTLPKLLTLWLDFGVEASRTLSKEIADDTRRRAQEARPKMLDAMNKQVKKYGDKIATYILYTALSQMITRIGHPTQKVYDVLSGIILRIAYSHPQQALWPLLAVVKASAHDRVKRGVELLNKLKEKGKIIRHENASLDLKALVTQGQKLSDQLLRACEINVEGRASTVSLSRELGFNMNIVPSPLVVPFQKHLTASLPSVNDSVTLKTHRAFPMSREVVTIASFNDEVTVLASLQRPRKITVRGSDGQKYSLLCKPNDDLRKDQRLMEFNTMINRSLKKDGESSKRRLYVRTYAVTPLNEACGLIEWVDGLKPLRDILLTAYRSKGVKVDYAQLRDLLNEACRTDNVDGHKIFSDIVLPMYKPVLHEWFADLFPVPDAWFAARLRYVRSCAVSSMVGYALGLGDRHGENVLLEEHSGGIFHVDFNCLFDKGLTFEKPELVPFRLTHNMVDAMGAYGVEGPWRRAAECALTVMRQNEDALLTVLETFVNDPTADFVGPRKKHVRGVPETPKDVLESVRGKVRGLWKEEHVPLSVQGHVDALVRQATDPKNLCAMYIGWCAFL